MSLPPPFPLCLPPPCLFLPSHPSVKVIDIDTRLKVAGMQLKENCERDVVSLKWKSGSQLLISHLSLLFIMDIDKRSIIRTLHIGTRDDISPSLNLTFMWCPSCMYLGNKTVLGLFFPPLLAPSIFAPIDLCLIVKDTKKDSIPSVVYLDSSTGVIIEKYCLDMVSTLQVSVICLDCKHVSVLS